MRAALVMAKAGMFVLGLGVALLLSNCVPGTDCNCPSTGPLASATLPMSSASSYGPDGNSVELPFGAFEATMETSESQVVITYTHGDEDITSTVRYSATPAF